MGAGKTFKDARSYTIKAELKVLLESSVSGGGIYDNV